jgi:two-component system chemotaxis response regulator CheB
MSPFHRSRLAELLAPSSSMPVEAARLGAPIEHGHVYLAVPDLHLGVDSGRLELTRGPKEHFTRPAIDVLFRSAARAYGPRVAGMLLCGGGYDGALGLGDIRAAGGITLVQDPKLVVHSGMLLSAIQSGNVDHVLSLGNIARALPALARGEGF